LKRDESNTGGLSLSDLKIKKYGIHISAKTEDQKHNRAEGIIY